MTIVDSLRRARKNSGTPLSEAASVSGVGVTNLSAIEHGRRDPTTATAQRVAAALGVSFVAVPARGRSTAAEAAAAILRADEAGNPALAYRSFIQLADDLGAVDAVTRVVLAAEEPERSRSRWTDAIAGLVELRLNEVGAPLPQWVRDTLGDPEHPWEPQRSDIAFPFPPDEELVPEPFRKRGVLIEENELSSA